MKVKELSRKKHAGGRPPKSRKAETAMKTTRQSIDWLFEHRRSEKEPLWQVLERIQAEVETLPKKLEATTTEIRDKDNAIQRLLSIIHFNSIDTDILETQLVDPIIASIKEQERKYMSNRPLNEWIPV